MAPRLGFSMRMLRAMQPAATESDVRLVVKKGDEWNMSLLTSNGGLVQLPKFCGTREMRLLASQLNHMADYLDRDESMFEELL